MSKRKTTLLKEYMKSLDKEGSDADYINLFHTEDFYKYRKEYAFEEKDLVYKEIYAGVMLDIMTGKMNEEDFDFEIRERLKKVKELRSRRNRAGLEVICHPALTRMLSGSKDKDSKIDWFDLELVSAISQAIRAASDCRDYVISIEKVYMLIYGRDFSRHSMKKEFLEKVESSLEVMDGIVDGSFDSNGLGSFIETPVLLDAKKKGNYVQIPVECIGESRCRMQDVKSYLLYRFFQKNCKYGKIDDEKRQGRLTLRDTMENELGWAPDDEMLRKVFKSLENDGFNAGFEKKGNKEDTTRIEVTKDKEDR